MPQDRGAGSRLFLTILLPALALLPCLTRGAAAQSVDHFTDKPDEWFETPQGRQVIDNIISWQNVHGGWWKAYDASQPKPANWKFEADPRWPLHDQNVTGETGSFDNKATYTEVRLLSRAFRVTHEPRYRAAAERGLKFVFDAQYPNGGWPQRWPLESNYGAHITFNDDAMVGVMWLLKDVADAKADFSWLDDTTRRRAKEAFDRGVECILNCQIEVDGKLTAWAQQHDAKTLAPAGGRSYELPALVSSESCDILMLLMRLDNPSPRVKHAVRAGVEWLERSKITGKRLEKRPIEGAAGGTDVFVVDDPSGEPLWARFYDIETNQPFYVGRDGMKKASLGEIERERRVGYAWLRPWGTPVLKEYATWAKKHGDQPVVATTHSS